MSANINTITFLGIDTNNIDVQVHIASGGLPAFNIVGLADKSIAESRERVRAAFASIGLAFPMKRITINLAPADILKDGSHFDLAIALGLLVSMHLISQDEISGYVVMGELSLNGSIKGVAGVLPAAIAANRAGRGLVCPADNQLEALYSGNRDILVFEHLLQLISHFSGKSRVEPVTLDRGMVGQNDDAPTYPDLADVHGQTLAKKALEIAAAGRHHMLMIGQPGSGKSMLAKRLPGIMSPLTPEEKLEISIIASLAGVLDRSQGIIHHRPFRSPHCSSSMAAMVGGGKNARPGEITLAHSGILFLDELPEFARNVLESLRQPTEDGYISLARVNNRVRYPARFQLIAAMNPCKCGYYGTRGGSMNCRKAPQCVYDYQEKISGPMFDRFDLQVETDEVEPFAGSQAGLEERETSAVVRERVVQACIIQKQRYDRLGWPITYNSQLEGEQINQVVQLDSAAQGMLEKAVGRFNMSMRGVHRVLKIARTIADLRGEEGRIELGFMAEALSYRISRSRGMGG